MILVNFLGAAIYSELKHEYIFSFIPQLMLIIPSPLRNLLGYGVSDTSFQDELSVVAQITGGGFSLVAQFYTDFGWGSSILFFIFGLVFGRLNKLILRQSYISIYTAVTPLLFAAFILSLRNDFGVFLKYSLQLFVVALILALIGKLGIKKGRPNIGTPNKSIDSDIYLK